MPSKSSSKTVSPRGVARALRGGTRAALTRAADRVNGLSASNTDKGGQTISRAEASRTRVAGPPTGQRDIQASSGGGGRVTEAGPSVTTERLVARGKGRTGAGEDAQRIVGGEEGRVTPISRR